MNVDYGNVVRRARNELQRLRAIEKAHAAGDHRETERLLAGCDPAEVQLLEEQLAELTFILRSSRLMGAESLETFLEWYREFRQIDGGQGFGGGRQGTADGVAPAPEQHSVRCGPDDIDESGGVADLSPGERALLREVRTVGP